MLPDRQDCTDTEKRRDDEINKNQNAYQDRGQFYPLAENIFQADCGMNYGSKNKYAVQHKPKLASLYAILNFSNRQPALNSIENCCNVNEQASCKQTPTDSLNIKRYVSHYYRFFMNQRKLLCFVRSISTPAIALPAKLHQLPVPELPPNNWIGKDCSPSHF